MVARLMRLGPCAAVTPTVTFTTAPAKPSLMMGWPIPPILQPTKVPEARHGKNPEVGIEQDGRPWATLQVAGAHDALIKNVPAGR